MRIALNPQGRTTIKKNTDYNLLYNLLLFGKKKRKGVVDKGKGVGGKGVRFLFGKFVVIALLGSGVLRSNSITRKGVDF